MKPVVGDRIRFVNKDADCRVHSATSVEQWKAAFGMEGTVVQADGGFFINWDRGTGPNNYPNPDNWGAFDKNNFEIITRPHDWEEFLEFA